MRHRQYRFALDGVIFGIAVAMGFGGLESLGFGIAAYFRPYLLCGGYDGPSCLVQTLWLRTAAVFFGHGPWTAIICAVLWRERGRAARVLSRPVLLAFGLSVALHALWDLNPLVLGWPVAVVGLLALRSLMREGLSHQAGALASLALIPQVDRLTPEQAVRCGRCGALFPPSAIYCVRCGLALA
jgi:RsiW-degrading membrane proteinase PrsW (M82 family)